VRSFRFLVISNRSIYQRLWRNTSPYQPAVKNRRGGSRPFELNIAKYGIGLVCPTACICYQIRPSFSIRYKLGMSSVPVLVLLHFLTSDERCLKSRQLRRQELKTEITVSCMHMPSIKNKAFV
jgi:hypothetical protein